MLEPKYSRMGYGPADEPYVAAFTNAMRAQHWPQDRIDAVIEGAARLNSPNAEPVTDRDLLILSDSLGLSDEQFEAAMDWRDSIEAYGPPEGAAEPPPFSDADGKRLAEIERMMADPHADYWQRPDLSDEYQTLVAARDAPAATSNPFNGPAARPAAGITSKEAVDGQEQD